VIGEAFKVFKPSIIRSFSTLSEANNGSLSERLKRISHVAGINEKGMLVPKFSSSFSKGNETDELNFGTSIPFSLMPATWLILFSLSLKLPLFASDNVENDLIIDGLNTLKASPITTPPLN
jgi:hypothetical protein